MSQHKCQKYFKIVALHWHTSITPNSLCKILKWQALHSFTWEIIIAFVEKWVKVLSWRNTCLNWFNVALLHLFKFLLLTWKKKKRLHALFGLPLWRRNLASVTFWKSFIFELTMCFVFRFHILLLAMVMDIMWWLHIVSVAVWNNL